MKYRVNYSHAELLEWIAENAVPRLWQLQFNEVGRRRRVQAVPADVRVNLAWLQRWLLRHGFLRAGWFGR